MTDTFTWRPTNDARGTLKARVSRAKFGDGYSQAVPDGINPISGSWPLTFVGDQAEMQAMVDFLDAHVGVSFFWKPPLRPVGLYQCDAYDPKDEGGAFYTVTATFQQVFSP